MKEKRKIGSGNSLGHGAGRALSLRKVGKEERGAGRLSPQGVVGKKTGGLCHFLQSERARRGSEPAIPTQGGGKRKLMGE